jgi:hypothetical protein
VTQPIYPRFAVRGLPPFVLLAIVLAALPLGRALACDVKLEGNPSDAWREAVRRLPAAAAGDCASAILRVERGEARLIFLTQDGRRAERVLAGPEELAPSIAALSEAGPGERAPTVAAGATTSPQAQPAAAEAPPARELDVLGSLLGGARVGQYKRVSPVVSGSLLLRIRAWELGVMAAWETGYYPSGGYRAGRQNGAETTSLTFARRQPLPALTLLAGFRLGMAVRLHTPVLPSFAFVPDPGFAIHFVAPRFQGRVGPFVGFSLPRTALARLRFELGVELAFSGPNSVQAGHPWPFWAFALSVGMELGRP